MISQNVRTGPLRVLLTSIDFGSPALTCVKNYMRVEQGALVDTMMFGFPRTTKTTTTQEVVFTTGDGLIRDITVRFPRVLSGLCLPLFKLLVHGYSLIRFLWFTRRIRYDICIAETPTLDVVAFLLKKVGKFRMVVVRMADIYNSKGWSGKMQTFLRKIAYRNDVIWYIQERLRVWDNARGFRATRFFVVGDSFDENKAKMYAANERKLNQLCYIGRLDPYSGLDIVIKSIPLLKKNIPQVMLKVIGGYKEEDVLPYKELARHEGVEDHVAFLGYVEDRARVDSIISTSALGVAVYSPDENNGVLYTIPGKVTEYLQLGTPVVITEQGPAISEQIQQYGAGILVSYDPQDVAQKISEALCDYEYFRKLQQGVLTMTHQLSHTVIPPRIYEHIMAYYQQIVGQV